jgi:hypothetical protein
MAVAGARDVTSANWTPATTPARGPARAATSFGPGFF